MDINIFLPIENIVYKTTLSKEQVIIKLSENVEKEKSFGFNINVGGFKIQNSTYSKPYIGNVFQNTFEIKRDISYRNSFLPNIKGEVYSDYEGTKIKVSMKPHPIVLVFMMIWFLGVGLGCIATIFALFTKPFSPFFLIPFGMLIFGIGLLFGAFKTESSISKKDLECILEAEPL